MFSFSDYISFDHEAWQQYQYYLFNDRRYVKAINKLIASINRNGFNKGLGKPEILRHLNRYFKSGSVWSRRISKPDRLVYYVHDHHYTIISCHYHYHK